MTQPRPIRLCHDETAHARGRLTGRALNWADRPSPFMACGDVPAAPLPPDTPLPDVPLDRATAPREPKPGPDMGRVLSGVCVLAAGITRARELSDGKVFHFRAAPSAGALYPTELYVAVQGLRGPEDGLYHYCPLRHRLERLRTGRVLDTGPDAGPAIRFFLSSVFQRSAWKYGPRAYRYCLLDAGHMAENLYLAARIHGLPAVIDYDFNDAAVNRFLAVDPDHEGCLVQVYALGCGPDADVLESARPTADGLAARSAPAGTPVPEAILEAHRLTSSFARCPACPPPVEPGRAEPLPDPVIPAATAETILRRRSLRNFTDKPADPRPLRRLLALLARDLPPVCADSLCTGFLAGERSGIPPGHYRLDRAAHCAVQRLSGDLLAGSARACLDQGWLENAALHLTFSTDIAGLEARCGPRAYRYALLEAGRLGELAYLAATGQGLGACGIGAFFDAELAELLRLPEGHSPLYLVGLGPVRKSR